MQTKTVPIRTTVETRDWLEAPHAIPGAGDTGGELVGLSSLAELRHVTEILADAATRGLGTT